MSSVTRTARCVILELSADTSNISGQLIDEEGSAMPFSGWLGLASRLEQLFAPDPGDAAPGREIHPST
jgi:hypothetical protein